MTPPSTRPHLLTPGSVADLAHVMTVMRESFDAAFGEAWTEPQCAGVLGMPGCWLLLAHDGSTPTGFALARTIAGEAELLLIAVRPAWRGSGAGAALLEQIIDDARAAGALTLHLEVRADNAALALYRRAGFEQVGIRRAYYRGAIGQVFDALTFKRPLDATIDGADRGLPKAALASRVKAG